MNRYYQENEQFNSNNRIYEGYFTETERKVRGFSKVLEMLLYVLYLAMTSVRFHRVLRAVSLALCLVGIVGIVAAIECGTLSVGVGLSVGIAVVAIEILCLRHRQRS